MVSPYLVTTAMEETWPSEDAPILFLGEWCRLYNRASAWKNRHAVVAPYHWDDRRKLAQDYLYLQMIYERLLKEIVIELNSFHCVNYSVRYWRILVGPWLGYFVQMLFDRWSMLHQVLRDNVIAGVRVLEHPAGEGVPNDMTEFTQLFVSDQWNELIFGQILDWLGIPVEKIAAHNQKVPDFRSRVNTKAKLRCGLEQMADYLSALFCRENEYFFISSYLGMQQAIRLQAKLGQLPKLWRPVTVPNSPFDSATRQWRLPQGQDNDAFLTLARTLIPRQIPKAYVEGYRALVTRTENLPWPKRPKAIFTSNSFNADDVFKAWAALKVEIGIPLVIGQHGGTYGMALWCFIEDHQIMIADRFLTWGWTVPESTKVTPIGNFKGFAKKVAANKEGIALLVENALPRYSYHMYSAPVAAGQWLSYFDDQCRFVRALPVELRAQLLVRLHSQDYGLGQRQRWQACFPDIQIDDGVQSMARLIGKARIYISTYNATTFLESLSLNFPTIIFWNPNHWELRDTANFYLEKLKAVGIYHDTPESAARQMAEVWHDVTGWWQSAEVQSVRQVFCERYTHIPGQLLDVMANLIREIGQQ